MTKRLAVLVLLLSMVPTSRMAFGANGEDKAELEEALTQLQNAKTADEAWDSIQQFGFRDMTDLPADKRAAAVDLMFKYMDGSLSAPLDRLTMTDVRETAVRSVQRILWDAEEAGLPSPIPDANDRLLVAAAKSPDISGDAFQSVLYNIGEGSAALNSKGYKGIIAAATSDPNAAVRAGAISSLSQFFSGGDATTDFVLSRLKDDASPQVKAAALGGLSSIWLSSGGNDLEQAGVKRILGNQKVQDAILSGFELSKKFDDMTTDKGHPIACATFGSLETFANIGIKVSRDKVNYSSMVQPTAQLIEAAIGKLDSAYPAPTSIRCPVNTMFGGEEIATYDTGNVKGILTGILNDLREGAVTGLHFTTSCKDYVPAEQGSSLCATAVKTALSAVGCADSKVECSNPPDAWCTVESPNCSRARDNCPAAQVKPVKGDLKVCVGTSSAGTKVKDVGNKGEEAGGKR